jgi:hypothetical protein
MSGQRTEGVVIRAAIHDSARRLDALPRKMRKVERTAKRNTRTRTKRQQIECAGDDNVLFAIRGDFAKLFMFGTRAFGHGPGLGHEFIRREKAARPNRMDRADPLKQVRASHDVKNLSFRRGGLD